MSTQFRKTVKRRVQQMGVLWSCLFLTSVLAFHSCGTEESLDLTLEDKVPNAQAIPSKENFYKWKSDWHGSWIVALKPEADALISKKEFRMRSINALLAYEGLHAGSYAFERAHSFLESSLQIDLVDLTKASSRLTQIPGTQVLGFGSVSFKKRTQTWANFLEVAQMVMPSSHSDLEFNFMAHSWDALASMPLAAWVEPDIESFVLDAPVPANEGTYAPPAELSNSAIKTTFDKFKGELAYKWAAENGLKPVRTPVIAVIDTGIDYEHDKLKDQMFKNPSEVANGMDDDKNGYIDDLFGINATIESGLVDTGTVPTPGPADLGGPGKACPPADNEGVSGSCGHGTHVAGLIAAKATGSGDALGVCPVCKLYSFRATGRKPSESKANTEENTGISDLAQIRSLAYIISFTYPGTNSLHTNIVNMSIGKYFRSRSIAFLVRSISDSKVLIVAAAGNDDTETPSYPAAFSSVLSVCATSVEKSDSSKTARGAHAKTAFSNFGDWVDICAPGEHISSSIPGNEYGIQGGTSQATPIVAGAAGYLMSLKTDMFRIEAINAIKQYANFDLLYRTTSANEAYQGQLGNGTIYLYLGWGALDLENSVKSLRGAGQKNYITTLSENKITELQVTGGCVVSSLAGTGTIPIWHASMSAPFLLGQGWLILTFLRRRKTTRKIVPNSQ